ncbi:PEP-CTERM sorting domain-containing protein [Okeania sp. SIO1I7]|uniref:PEP-CTERM sorting domain-containing protein n=1 Tax=Okeania sp. SIO1I7 TaxID=2607772 RepID=UPI0025E5AC13|nr:PEP-CTERM sorting domain-containing protein [Okeania sp. SIO1I7]
MLSRSLIGAVGLSASAMALLAVTQSSNAATVNPGLDYVFTPTGSATFFFDDPIDIGFVTFKGLPIDSSTLGITDTIIRRTDPVSEPSGDTPIIIEDLSLVSVEAVGGKDVFVGLDPNMQSGGEMTIRHDESGDGGTWDSFFDINGIAIIADAGTLNPTGPDFIKNLIAGCPSASYECQPFQKGTFIASNEPWSMTPGSDNFVGPESSNFFLTAPVIHDAGDGTIHIVEPTPVPEPSATLALTLFALAGTWGLKKKQSFK